MATAKKRRKSKPKKNQLPQIPPPFWKNRNASIVLGAILLTCFMVFSGALDANFVNWDDDVNLLENIYTERLTGENIKKIFTTHVIGNYNPLSIFTLAVERHFFGIDSARPYHLTNILLHLLAVIFVFRSVRLLGGGLLAAGITAALFAIHPMRIESVAWVTERKDVLFGSLYFAAFTCYLRYLKTDLKDRKWLYFALALFIPALLAKIQAVFLPVSMLAADLYLHRRVSWKLVTEKIPFFILSLLTGLVGLYFLAEQGSLNATEQVTVADSLGNRLLIGSRALVVYLVKGVYPYELSPLYPYPAVLDWTYFLAPVPALGLIALTVVAYLKKWRTAAFGLAFFLVNIVMMLQILGAGQGFQADRFTYVAYFGLFFIVAIGIENLMQTSSKYILPAGIAGTAWLVLLTAGSVKQVKIWDNSETLWTHVLSHYDQNATAWRNRGHYLREQGRIQEGTDDLRMAMKYDPDNGMLYNSLGKVYFDQGQYQPALEAYTKAISLETSVGEIYINRGASYGMLGNLQAALEDMNTGLRLNPEFLRGYLNRSLVHFNLGNFQEANNDLTTYLRYRPDSPNILYERSLTFSRLGNYQAAMQDIERSIQLAPNDPNAWMQKSRINRALGNNGQADADAQRANQLNQ
jgi:tetratricopeptide (TPR) repeat protein